MGLYSIKLNTQAFFDIVKEDSVLEINKDTKTIHIEGVTETFTYQKSDIEETLLDAGGVLPLYNQIGKQVFRHITRSKVPGGKKRKKNGCDNGMGFSMESDPPSLDW